MDCHQTGGVLCLRCFYLFLNIALSSHRVYAVINDSNKKYLRSYFKGKILT